MTRVWEMLERSRRSLRDGAARQRLEVSTRQLLERSRETVAHIVGPTTGEPSAQEVLASVCSSVALRDLNLVDSLLEQLERMEAHEEDPDSLARLYQLDHLATRLRRNGENLRVLAGREAGTGDAETAALVDVIRAGMSAIEHYNRVEMGSIATLGVVGLAADDVSRLLAELLDNATTHSPPNSSVTVSAHLTEQGSMMIRVEDSGIGLPAARLSVLNERLASSPVLDRNAVRHMGLAVVRRLSSKHGIRVWLARRAPHGTTASVLLPPTLVRETPVPAARKLRRPETDTAAGVSDRSSSDLATAQRAAGSRDAEQAEHPRFPETTPPETDRRSGEPSAQPPQQSATTANGLPRRVSRSLKESAVAWPPPPAAETRESTQQDLHESHEQLLSDLGAFTEGEQAARDDHRDHTDAAEGPEQ